MWVCSASMAFTVEDRYLIKSLRDSKCYGTTCLCTLSEKRRIVNWLKTLIKQLSTLALSIVYQVGLQSAGDVPTCTSYLIILLTELRDVLICRAIWNLQLWVNAFSSYDRCKTFDVVDAGRRSGRTSRYLSSTLNLIVAKEIYITSELCHRYQGIFVHYFNNLYIAKI